MKLYYLLMIVLISFFIAGCSRDSNIAEPVNEKDSGKLSLSFDKMNAPTDAVVITAYLSRQGFETLSKSVNIVTDTTGEVSFSAVSVGLWRLKIDVKNSSGVITYTGESDVNILPNITTQLSLTLTPTGAGETGNVKVFIKWGVPLSQSRWLDYFANPILSKGNNAFETKGYCFPKVLADSGNYIMFYSPKKDDLIFCICRATSFDGNNWVKNPSVPVLVPGQSGAWDETVFAGGIIKDANQYKLYYSGGRNYSGPYQIGMATSDDAVQFTKLNNPIISTLPNEYSVNVSDVIKYNNFYYMYFTSIDYEILKNYKINLAISSDGIHFERYAGNPILTSTFNWEGNEGVSNPSVMFENGVFTMIYERHETNNTKFGFAISTDGKNFQKQSSYIFGMENVLNNWATLDVGYPNIRKINNQIRVYYTGQTIYDDRLGYFYKAN